MEKKKHRSLEEILDSLKDAEKEFDEKLDKYGFKNVKKEEKQNDDNDQEPQDDNTDNLQNTAEDIK